MKHFDVIVIGGGHAGADAAHAAARAGAQTALVTLSRRDIGVMSCNPAIGGLGKGHLVREIDALDGVMARVADKAGIQFRLLNRRKGPAVQGPRAQADRKIYREAMLQEIERQPNLSIIEGEAADFLMDGGCVTGIRLLDESEISAKAVVLTTGTFLRGVIHIGDVSRAGGRMGDKPSVKLAERVDSFGLTLGRLKTGTPPRLDGNTISWDGLDEQPGDDDPVLFSFLSKGVSAAQVSCGITHTNEKTHNIIRENLVGPASYVKMTRLYDVKPILGRLEINGKPSFQGHIVIREDSRITSLAALEGRRFAFGNENSTMSSLVPKYMLQQAGLTLKKLASFSHLGSHNDVALGVLLGKFDAGAVKEEVYYKYRERGLKSLAATPAIAEHLFVVRSTLDKETAAILRNALLSVASARNSYQIMKSIKPTVSGFVAAEDRDYDKLRTILAAVSDLGS